MAKSKLDGEGALARMKALRAEAQDLRDEITAHCRSTDTLPEAAELQRAAVVAGNALSDVAVVLFAALDLNMYAQAMKNAKAAKDNK